MAGRSPAETEWRALGESTPWRMALHAERKLQEHRDLDGFSVSSLWVETVVAAVGAMKWRGTATDALLAVAVVAGITVLIGAVESVSHVANISNLYIIAIAILAGAHLVGVARAEDAVGGDQGVGDRAAGGREQPPRRGPSGAR